MLRTRLIALCVWMLVALEPALAIDRHYYIRSEETQWIYAPLNTDNVDVTNNSHALDFIENRADRIGASYTKLVYRAYTDDTYTTLVPQPPWGGFVGPMVKAEEGDDVYIHFRNDATNVSVSIFTHGFSYSKGNEGAAYGNGLGGSGDDILDNAIAPGQTFTYHWEANALSLNNRFHENCAAFTYHSHVNVAKDVDAGLVGVSLICKQGTLDATNKRKDYDEEIVLYADVTDENKSWYLEQNLQRCGNSTSCAILHETGDYDFLRSNKMSHMNGFVYGNMPDIEVYEGKRVVLYLLSMQRGIHTIHINGHTMKIEQHRTDTVTLLPGSVYSSEMTPVNPGRWLISSRNQDDFVDGMQAFLQVKSCTTTTRYYYLAIEEGSWTYASGNVSHPQAGIFLNNGSQRIGATYKKARFVQYKDETFRKTKSRDIHWGVAGPPIKAQVGEHVVVNVWNKANRTFSFLANGVALSISNEGSLYQQKSLDGNGASISAGETVIYEFDVNEAVGPEPEDEACIVYVYQSAVDFNRDIHTGLFGPLLVCKAGTLTSDGRMIGVDREFYLNWMVIEENLSWYIDDNMATLSGATEYLPMDEDFVLSNQMRAINGRTFGTLEGLDMYIGEKVMWFMYGLGGKRDHHRVSFEGNNFKYNNLQQDTVSVFPGIGVTLTMTPDQAGSLLLRDAQLRMEFEGMYAMYNVKNATDQAQNIRLYDKVEPERRGIKRTYYIGIVQGEWEYCAHKTDPVNGNSLLNPEHQAYKYVRNDSYYLGTKFEKVMFREYTDGQFTTQKTRTSDEEHLGMLGPFININVLDELEIVLKNFATSPYNTVPKNVVLMDGSPISDALATEPNEIRTYNYFIPERSGPTPDQPNCVGNIYTSRVNPLKDPHSGLLGPLVVCKRGVLDASGTRTDNVAKEFAGSLFIYNENLSNLRDINFVTAEGETLPEDVESNPYFIESNLFYSINGYIFANQPSIVLNMGEPVAWYFIGFGDTDDLHTVHLHGQEQLRKTSISISSDEAEVWGNSVVEVLAGTAETVEMVGNNAGYWLYHCHQAENLERGMTSAYTVTDNERRRKRSSAHSALDRKRRYSVNKLKQGRQGTLTLGEILKP